MKKILGFFVIILFGITSQTLWATDYYVDSTNGIDSNNGLSPSTAWRTITRVNNAMGIFQPGDSILFKTGETWGGTTPLSITCSGSSGNPITFGAYGSGDRPAFNGATMTDPPINGRPAITYITVEHIYIYGYSRTGIFFGDHGWDTNITISNCEVNGGSNGIFIDRTDTYIIEDCTVHNCSNGGIVIYGSSSQQVTNGIIRNCTAYDIGQDGIVIHRDGDYNTAGPNHYIYNCLAYNCGEQGFDITAGSNILIRDCETYGNTDAGYAIGHHVDTIYIENCYGHDSDKSEFYIVQADNLVIAKSIVDNPGRRSVLIRDVCEHIYLANNTFISGENAQREVLSVAYDSGYDSGRPNDVKARNNILTEKVDSNQVELVEYIGGTPDNTNSDFDYNRFWRIGANPSSILFQDPSQGMHNLSRRQRAYGEDINSYVGDPQLNFSSYAPNPDSLCINSGGWLTTITSSTGNGRQFQVADARWFHDGFGVASGSLIQIQGQYTPVRITSVNYSTNTIGVNQDISGVQGYGIAFAYNGNAPDIGANEYGGNYSLNTIINASSTSGEAPLEVSFTGNVARGTPPYRYRWDFGDGGTSSLRDPTYTFEDTGTYIVSLTITDSENNQGIDIFRIHVYSNAPVLSISSVTAQPALGSGGTTDPSPGIYSYSPGSSIQLRAILNANYRFSRWTGDVSDSDIWGENINITMDGDKSATANFFTRCGDLNGDLSISPSDAQIAFSLYLNRISNPSFYMLENADVNCDGTRDQPRITPRDAQAIFDRYLGRGGFPCDCSGNSRSSAVLTQARINNRVVDISLSEIETYSTSEIGIPIVMSNPFKLNAFGFDFIYPSGNLEFIGVERTELSHDFYQLDSVEMADGILRIGGYKSDPIQSQSPGTLVKIIFRVREKGEDSYPFFILNTVDDLENASVKIRKFIRRNSSLKDKVTKKI